MGGMKSRTWWTIIVLLLCIIVAMALLLLLTPKPAHAPTTDGIVATSTTDQPLHTRVVIASPAANATVAGTFTVTGEAPGNWYFEASFPVQVYDPDHNKLAGVPAQAQSDWMTTAQVPFTAQVTVSGYTGPATLVLLRDNPSGLPQNDDSLSIPIVIQ